MQKVATAIHPAESVAITIAIAIAIVNLICGFGCDTCE